MTASRRHPLTTGLVASVCAAPPVLFLALARPRIEWVAVAAIFGVATVLVGLAQLHESDVARYPATVARSRLLRMSLHRLAVGSIMFVATAIPLWLARSSSAGLEQFGRLIAVTLVALPVLVIGAGITLTSAALLAAVPTIREPQQAISADQ